MFKLNNHSDSWYRRLPAHASTRAQAPQLAHKPEATQPMGPAPYSTDFRLSTMFTASSLRFMKSATMTENASVRA